MITGTEDKKKLYALLGLGALAGYMLYSNVLSGPATPNRPPRTSDTAAVRPSDSAAPDITRTTGTAAKRPSSKGKSVEFRPVLKSKKKEEIALDPLSIDPTIRFDLLAKANAVPPAGGLRDLFQITKGPPVTSLSLANEPKILPPFRDQGPHPPPPPPPPQPTPGPPPPEPITLRYYGVATIRPDGKRTAYFIDGEDILDAIEGQTLKGRYLIVQIGVDKVLVEDKVQKRRQSLNIEPEAISG